MKYFVGLLAVVAIVAGATVGAYRLWDTATHTRSDDNGGVLAATASTLAANQAAPADGQVFVSGTVTDGHADGAVLPALATPFTVTTPQRGEGAGATISGIEVDGKSSSIEWDAGRPLEVTGDGGSLLLAPVALDLSGNALTLTLDGQPHGLAPGTYTINTPVAVATGGLARPADQVTFTASADSRVEFRGGATTPWPGGLTCTGQGGVTLHGALQVAHPDRSITTAGAITLDGGTYEIAVNPVAGGWAILAKLAGTTH